MYQMMENLPKSVFAGFGIDSEHIYVAIKDDNHIYEEKAYISDSVIIDKLLFDWLKNYQIEKNVKVVSAGIGEADEPESLGESLWLQQDIVPILKRGKGENGKERANDLANTISEGFKTAEGLDIAKVEVPEDRRIDPSFLTTLKPYEELSSAADWNYLLKQAQRFRALGGKMIFINSTPQGGGVALMRHALIRLYRMLGVEAAWYVMKPEMEVFDITKKKFHNVLQGVAPAGVYLTDEDKKVYLDWAKDNGKLLEPAFKWANVIVIDDWQPSGLIKYIKEVNPEAKILFRSHIHIDTTLFKEGSPQKITWDFVWDNNRIKDTDVFISHPIEGFVPDVVPQEKVVLMPAATDPLDGLNKPLYHDQMNYYLTQFNKLLEKDYQKPLDLSRPYIAQIARFDPSKGIPDVLEAYRDFKKKLEKQGFSKQEIPQLVIAGHGAVDDPEGIPIIEETKMTITTNGFRDIADDIKLARLPHNDQILNAVLRGATVALQLSHKEGCEVKVTETLHKGKPVIIYTAGGMHLQVLDKINSFVIEVGRTSQVADKLLELFTNNGLYEEMSKNAIEKVKHEFFTVNNAFNWLFLANELLEKGSMNAYGKDIINSMKEKNFNNSLL